MAEADEEGTSLDIVEVRKRLGLTEDQMASALNVTTRTLQNWEKEVGKGQLGRRTRDLRELLALMDDYVVCSKEREWLETPLPARRGRLAPRAGADPAPRDAHRHPAGLDLRGAVAVEPGDGPGEEADCGEIGKTHH